MNTSSPIQDTPLAADVLADALVLHAALDSIGGYVFAKDLQGRYTYANPLVCELFGLALADILGRDDAAFFDFSLQDQLRQHDRRVLHLGEEVAQEEVNVIKATGQTRIYWTVKRPIRDAHGQIVGMTGISTDITDRKHLEEKLQRSEQRFHTLFDKCPDPVWIIEGHRFVECNQAAIDILRYPDKKTLTDTHPSELSPPEQPDGEPSYSKAERMMNLAQAHGMHRFEWVHRRADGSDFLAEVTLSTIELDGHPAIYCVWRDISERVAAERALRASEARFRSLYDSMTEGVALHELVRDALGEVIDYRIVDVNPAFERMFSQPREALVGRLGSHVHGQTPPPRLQAYAQMAASGEGFAFEVEDAALARTFAVSAFAPSPDTLATVYSDVTEQRRRAKRFHTMLEAAPVPMVGVTQLGQFTYLNTAFTDTLGYTADDLPHHLESWWLKAYPDPDYRATVQARWATHIAHLEREGSHAEPVKVDVRCKDGQVRTMLVSGSLLQDADQTDYVVSLVDITELDRSRQAIQHFETVFHQAGWGMLLIDANNQRIRHVNAAYATMHGCTPQEMLGSDNKRWVAPEFWDRIPEITRQAMAHGHHTFESEHVRKDGSRFPCRINVTVFWTPDGRPDFVSATVEDISLRRQAEERLRLASMVFEHSGEAILVTDAQHRILTVNPAYSHMCGRTEAEMLGTTPTLLNSSLHDDIFYRDMQQRLAGSGHWRGEIWDHRANGEAFPAELDIRTIHDSDGGVHRRVFMATDITLRKQAEREIAWQAHYDPLTRLPNRRLFQDRLLMEIRKAEREHLMCALLFVDLDHFKDINDSQGHDLGDALLVQAAERISAHVRDYDTVARFGGDEFVVVLSGLNQASTAGRIAQAVIDALSAPFHLGETDFFISASVGIALFPDDGDNATDLVKCADQAMYSAKADGRHCFRFFTPTMQEAVATRARLAVDMRTALQQDQFSVHYQPIVDLATGEVRKAEALLRWNHPVLGMVSPSVFVPIAEESGVIREIGDWVFLQAAEQVRRWRASRAPDFQVSVNKSPVQFRQGLENSLWAQTLDKLGLVGNSVVIEITEGVLIDNSEHVTHTLLQYRDAGVQVAIDDFGTGYSALSYLKKFDIDYLKIDQSFTRQLSEHSPDFALCEAIVVMAHKLGLKVIAEGVETLQQRDLLRAIGCDYAQGYLFSRPVPVDAFEAYLDQGAATLLA